MQLSIVAAPDAMSLSLAEVLSRQHTVKMLHPGRLELTCGFADRQIALEDLGPEDLSGADAVVYVASPELRPEWLRAVFSAMSSRGVIPLVCVSCRPFAWREGRMASVEEALCDSFSRKYGLNICRLNLPAIYGDDFFPQVLMESVVMRGANNRVVLPAAAQDACDMLHVDDLASLIGCLLEQKALPESLVITSGYNETVQSFAARVKEELRLADVQITGTAEPSAAIEADTVEGWMPAHSFLADFAGVLDSAQAQSVFEIRASRSRKGAALLRFGLFALLFAAVCLYTGFVKVSSELQFVDVRLLFIAGVSLYLGGGYGLAAGVLCSAASVTSAILSGTAWYVIFFHIDNWIPVAVYLAAAVLFGMYRDNHQKRNNGGDQAWS